MERIRRKFGFRNGIDVPAEGSRGGLCLRWREGLSVDLRSFNNNCIDVLVNDPECDLSWRFTGFYGCPNGRRRAETWDLLM